MTGGLGIQLRKEVRALLPWWLCVGAVTAAVMMLANYYYVEDAQRRIRNDLRLLGLATHSLGVLALAALSMGHELTHGTLASLLVQPSSRLRLLFLKLAVLVAAVASLGLLATWLPLRCCWQVTVPSEVLVWAPVAAAIGLVPLLTLLTRKPLGGVVFAIAIPGLMFGMSQWVYPLQDSRQASWLAWYGTLLASSLGLFALTRMFPRVEAAGDSRSGYAPRAKVVSDRGTTAPQSWWWLVVKKEIRIQSLTLAVSGLYVVAAVFILVAQRMNPDYIGPTFEAITLLHAGFVALLVGALASAEERHLGTLPSQILMPRAASRQWLVKAGVSLGLTAGLTVGLPVLLMFIQLPADPIGIEEEFVLGVLLATCGAIYVSSLSSNSLWALLAALPAIGLALALTGGLTTPIIRGVRSWIPVDHRRVGEVLRAEFGTDAWQARSEQLAWLRWLERDALIWVTGGVALLTLYFAARNHRSLDRSIRTIATQVTALMLTFWTGAIACFAIARMAYGAIR